MGEGESSGEVWPSRKCVKFSVPYGPSTSYSMYGVVLKWAAPKALSNAKALACTSIDCIPPDDVFLNITVIPGATALSPFTIIGFQRASTSTLSKMLPKLIDSCTSPLAEIHMSTVDPANCDSVETNTLTSGSLNSRGASRSFARSIAASRTASVLFKASRLAANSVRCLVTKSCRFSTSRPC